MAQANIDINLLFNEGKGLDNVITKLATIQKSTIDLSSAQKTSMDAMVASFKQMTAEVDTLSKSLKNTIKPSEINKIVAKLKEQEAAIVGLENKTSKLVETQNKSSKAITKTTGKINILKKSVKRLKLFAAGETDIKTLERINARLQQTQAEMRRLANVGKKSTNTFGNALTSFGFKFNILANIVSRVGSAITSGIIRTFSDAKDTILDFEQSQATLAAILQKSRSEVQGLTEDAKRFGATTFFTATQVESLQIALAKLGFGITDIRGATQGILSLAAAFRVDLGEAATVTASTLRGFNLDATESGRVADVIASAFANSALDLEKFKVAISKVAPIASGLNVSLEATTAALGTLTNKGFDASTAGTQLRNIFLKFADVNSDLTKRIGFTVRSSEDFIEAFKVLNSQGLKVEDTMKLVDKRSVALLQALTNAAGATGELNKEFEKAAGTADRMAEEQLKTLSGSLLLLASAWDAFILSVQDGTGSLAETVKWLIAITAEAFNIAAGMERAEDSLTSAQKEIRESAQALIKFGKAVLFLVQALTYAKVGVVVLTTAWKVLTSVGWLFRIAMLKATIATNLQAAATAKAAGANMTYAAATARATIATRALRIAMLQNPFTLIAVAIAAAVAATVLYISSLKDVATQQKTIETSSQRLTRRVKEERVAMQKLFIVAKDTTRSQEERAAAIGEINDVYGKYLPNLLKESATVKELAAAQRDLNRSMVENIKLKIRQEEIAEILTKQLELQAKLTEVVIRETTEALADDDIRDAFLFIEEFNGLTKLREEFDALRDSGDGSWDQLKTLGDQINEVEGEIGDTLPLIEKAFATFADANVQRRFKLGGQEALTEEEKNLRELAAALLAVSASLEKDDKALNKIFDSIKMAVPVMGQDNKLLTGRLNEIETTIKSLNKSLKELSVTEIQRGDADAITKKINALKLESNLIKTLGDETKNSAAIQKGILVNEIRLKKLKISTVEDEIELIDKASKKEALSLEKKLTGLREERAATVLAIEGFKGQGTAATQQIIKRQENIDKLIEVITKTKELTLIERDQAIARVKFNALVLENQDEMVAFELQSAETLADTFFKNESKKRQAQKDTLLLRQAQIEEEKQALTDQFESLTGDARLLAEADYRSQITDLEAEEVDKRITLAEMEQQRREEIFNRGVAATKASINAVGDFQQAAANKATEEVRQTRDTQLRIIKQHLVAGLISEQQYQLRKTFFEEQAAEKIAKIKQDQAEKAKQIAIIQAIIDGAVAIQKTAATLGYPLAIPFVAALTFQTAAQVALIESQPIPQFEDGGRVDPGMLYGPRHKKGGITVEAEGGEFFNDRKSTNAYLPYLEAANEMRLPEFIMSNDVKPMLELQMAGVNKGLAESMANSMGFYDGNIVRQLQGEKKELRRQTELLEKMATNQHRNARA